MNQPPCDLSICEIIVRKHLSVVRAELAECLVNERGISPAQVAAMMGQSRASISQYLSKKRGIGAVPLSSELESLIKRWADSIINGDDNIIICDICRCIHNSQFNTQNEK